MKINHKNADNKKMTTATIRMKDAEYRKLRAYMHTAEGAQVVFPDNIRLIRRGFGWFTLQPGTHVKHVLKSMHTAIGIMKRFDRDEAARIEAELREWSLANQQRYDQMYEEARANGTLVIVPGLTKQAPEPARITAVQVDMTAEAAVEIPIPAPVQRDPQTTTNLNNLMPADQRKTLTIPPQPASISKLHALQQVFNTRRT